MATKANEAKANENEPLYHYSVVLRARTLAILALIQDAKNAVPEERDAILGLALENAEVLVKAITKVLDASVEGGN